VERVLQMLDDLDDVASWIHQAWLAIAWPAAGLAGLLAVILAVALPG
jgi:hypothetical protein